MINLLVVVDFQTYFSEVELIDKVVNLFKRDIGRGYHKKLLKGVKAKLRGAMIYIELVFVSEGLKKSIENFFFAGDIAINAKGDTASFEQSGADCLICHGNKTRNPSE